MVRPRRVFVGREDFDPDLCLAPFRTAGREGGRPAAGDCFVLERAMASDRAVLDYFNPFYNGISRFMLVCDDVGAVIEFLRDHFDSPTWDYQRFQLVGENVAYVHVFDAVVVGPVMPLLQSMARKCKCDACPMVVRGVPREAWPYMLPSNERMAALTAALPAEAPGAVRVCGGLMCDVVDSPYFARPADMYTAPRWVSSSRMPYDEYSDGNGGIRPIILHENGWEFHGLNFLKRCRHIKARIDNGEFKWGMPQRCNSDKECQSRWCVTRTPKDGWLESSQSALCVMSATPVRPALDMMFGQPLSLPYSWVRLSDAGELQARGVHMPGLSLERAVSQGRRDSFQLETTKAACARIDAYWSDYRGRVDRDCCETEGEHTGRFKPYEYQRLTQGQLDVVCVTGPCGSGKTNFLSGVITAHLAISTGVDRSENRNIDRRQRVVYISPRVSQLREFHKTMTLLLPGRAIWLYDQDQQVDEENNRLMDKADLLMITMHSVGKLNGLERPPEVVILDEVLTQCSDYSSRIVDRCKVARALGYLVFHARRLFMADADYSADRFIYTNVIERVNRFVTANFPVDERRNVPQRRLNVTLKTSLYDPVVKDGRAMFVIETNATFRSIMLEYARRRKRFGVFVSNRKEAHAVVGWLRLTLNADEFEWLNPIVFTSDEALPKGSTLTEVVDGGGHNVLVYSTRIGVGNSLDCTFHALFCIINGNHLTGQCIRQAVERVRTYDHVFYFFDFAGARATIADVLASDLALTEKEFTKVAVRDKLMGAFDEDDTLNIARYFEARPESVESMLVAQKVQRVAQKLTVPIYIWFCVNKVYQPGCVYWVRGSPATWQLTDRVRELWTRLQVANIYQHANLDHRDTVCAFTGQAIKRCGAVQLYDFPTRRQRGVAIRCCDPQEYYFADVGVLKRYLVDVALPRQVVATHQVEPRLADVHMCPPLPMGTPEWAAYRPVVLPDSPLFADVSRTQRVDAFFDSFATTQEERECPSIRDKAETMGTDALVTIFRMRLCWTLQRGLAEADVTDMLQAEGINMDKSERGYMTDNWRHDVQDMDRLVRNGFPDFKPPEEDPSGRRREDAALRESDYFRRLFGFSYSDAARTEFVCFLYSRYRWRALTTTPEWPDVASKAAEFVEHAKCEPPADLTQPHPSDTNSVKRLKVMYQNALERVAALEAAAARPRDPSTD